MDRVVSDAAASAASTVAAWLRASWLPMLFSHLRMMLMQLSTGLVAR
jgi:hypothetical protein